MPLCLLSIYTVIIFYIKTEIFQLSREKFKNKRNSLIVSIDIKNPFKKSPYSEAFADDHEGHFKSRF